VNSTNQASIQTEGKQNSRSFEWKEIYNR